MLVDGDRPVPVEDQQFVGRRRWDDDDRRVDATVGCVVGRDCSVAAGQQGEPAQQEDEDDDEGPGSPRAMACLLYTSPSPRDRTRSRMPSSA